MKQKADEKYFKNMKLFPENKDFLKGKSKGNLNSHPYTSKEIKFASPIKDISSLAGTETRTKSNSIVRPQTAADTQVKNNQKCNVESSVNLKRMNELSINEEQRPIKPYTPNENVSIEKHLNRIKEIKSMYKVPKTMKNHKNKINMRQSKKAIRYKFHKF